MKQRVLLDIEMEIMRNASITSFEIISPLANGPQIVEANALSERTHSQTLKCLREHDSPEKVLAQEIKGSSR